VKKLWERLQIDLIDFWHLGQKYQWCLYIRDHFSKFSAAYRLETKESESVDIQLGGFIGIIGIPSILQCDNGTEFKGACDQLVKHHGIPVVHSKPRTPQTNGLIEQANRDLKFKILAWMTDMVSTEWWLELPEPLLSMNRQVHSTTGKSPYEIVFTQLMPDRPRISTSQRSTPAAIEQLHYFQGPVITQPDTPLDSSIAPSIDPLLNDSGESCTQQNVIASIQSNAVRVLNEEVISNTP